MIITLLISQQFQSLLGSRYNCSAVSYLVPLHAKKSQLNETSHLTLGLQTLCLALTIKYRQRFLASQRQLVLCKRLALGHFVNQPFCLIYLSQPIQNQPQASSPSLAPNKSPNLDPITSPHLAYFRFNENSFCKVDEMSEYHVCRWYFQSVNFSINLCSVISQ